MGRVAHFGQWLGTPKEQVGPTRAKEAGRAGLKETACRLSVPTHLTLLNFTIGIKIMFGNLIEKNSL